MSASEALLLTQRLLGVAALLAAAEAVAARRMLVGQGLLSWRISRLQRPRLCSGRTSRVMDAILGGRRIWLVLGGRALAAVVLVVAPHPIVSACAAAALTALLLVLHYGVPQGNDGSDQVTLIIAVAVALALVVPADSVARELCLGFIAAQLLLSYAASGTSKLLGPSWRSGAAVGEITATHTYGSRTFSRLLGGHRRLSQVASWSTIGFELAMPAVLLLPATAALLLLAVAAGFHLSVAGVMGLNTFIPAFAAGYPSIVWLSQLIH